MPGPLVPSWRAVQHGTMHAGALHDVRVEVANEGTAPWRRLFLSYHWLDERGNPIVWDGLRTALERVVEPGTVLAQTLRVRGPIPPGPYRLAIDLVEEHRFWLPELGNEQYEEAVDVQPRDAAAARVFGADPPGEWIAQAAELHRDGYAAVGGAVEGLRRPEYAPGGGRNPRFPHPLVLPSLLAPLEPNCEVDGRPAWRPDGDEPFMFDGRLVLRLR